MRDFVHLSRFEHMLCRGAEWSVRAPFWAVLQLKCGVAYASSGRVNEELLAGGVLLLAPHSPLIVLASQLSEASLRGFPISIGSLLGLVTATERMCLQGEVAQECAPFRQLPPSHPLAQRLNQVFQNEEAPSLSERLAFIQAFAEWLAPVLAKAASKKDAQFGQDPKARLQGFLNQMPESELASLSLGDVARHLCCCVRHASRLFYDLFGCSFRTYITDLRLNKACQMLVEAEHKIIDVAMESGHSSLAQFNYAFKNRFGMSPSEWRGRQLSRRARPSEASLLAVLG